MASAIDFEFMVQLVVSMFAHLRTVILILTSECHTCLIRFI